jgi:hypothetical protein
VHVLSGGYGSSSYSHVLGPPALVPMHAGPRT